MEHSPYSLDIAPHDFFLISKIKLTLKGMRFETLQTVKDGAMAIMNMLSKYEFLRLI